MQFTAYGLTIESEIHVADLAPGCGRPEVTVRLARLEKPQCAPDAPKASVIYDGAFCIFWRDVGTFFIRQGREILVDPEPGAEAALVQLYLLGPALAILLHQRGLLVLHASVVSINGYVVGFMGEKGWGKSTTAAALNARGHPLVADDILAIATGNDAVSMVQPGPAHFKLWPEAAMASFGDDPSRLARLHSQIEKRARLADTPFLNGPVPLRRLYVLGGGSQLESVPMPPPAALLALVQHSYLSGLMKSLNGLDANFRQCAAIARSVVVSSLRRPKDLGALRDIARLVEDEAGREQELTGGLAAAIF